MDSPLRLGAGAHEVTPHLLLILILKFLQSFGYYGLSIALTSFLTDDFGATDIEAGSIYGMLGMMTAVFSLISGPIIDTIGMQRSLLLGSALCGVARAGLACTSSLPVATGIICTVLPFGESFGIPVLSKAVGASCTDASRKWGYGLFYTAMNVGVLCIGPSVDSIRAMGDRGGFTPYKWLALLCSAAAFGSMVLTWCLLGDIDHGAAAIGGGDSRKVGGDGKAPSRTSAGRACTGTEADVGIGGRGQQQEVQPPLWTPTFRRFLLMVLLLSGVRTMFRHLDATLPKYITRAFGCVVCWPRQLYLPLGAYTHHSMLDVQPRGLYKSIHGIAKGLCAEAR
jgi:proton-dependent oligopeptide transporter, POT family